MAREVKLVAPDQYPEKLKLFMKEWGYANERLLAVYKHGQWMTLLLNNDIIQVNLDEGGNCLFYMSSLGSYGQPLIHAEPDFGINIPDSIRFVSPAGTEVKPQQYIAGIICKEDGRVVHRLSLSNAMKQGIHVEVRGDGSMIVGEEVWYLEKILIKDKNRITGLDAFLSRRPPEDGEVLVLELEDL